MLALLITAPTSALGVVAAVAAVDVPVIAPAAEEEEAPAPIKSAKNLPEIVHSRASTAGNSTTAADS
jgi:hypothetical protein